MRAALTTRYGGSEVLRLADVPMPVLGDHDVLVEVRATTVTAGDERLRSGNFPSFTAVIGRLLLGIRRPRHAIQGTMFAGRVVQIGSGVTQYAVGDDVFGAASRGAYAEFLAMPEGGAMAKMPRGATYDQAAAVPHGGVTALRFLRDKAHVQKGETVLILGAAGGVGRFAVQIAKHLGANVVAVCGREHHAVVRDLGADELLDRNADWSAPRYDVIFDCAHVTSFGRARASLEDGGRYLALDVDLPLLFAILFTALFGRKRALLTVAFGTHADLELLAEWLAAGVLTPVVGADFPLDKISAAHASRKTLGNVIVHPSL